MSAARWVATVGLLLQSLPAGAEEDPLPVEEEVDRLSFDRPESWAMKYYAAVVLPTGMGVPSPVRFGALRLGLEAGWIPALSAEERRVGFNGEKKEDLNKVPILGRLRLAVGLPRDFTLDATWTPPIEVNGTRSHPISFGVGRPLIVARPFLLGLRGFVGRHHSRGSFTCSQAAEPLPMPEEPAHEEPAGEEEHAHTFDMSDCAAPSNDAFTGHFAGLEVAAGYVVPRAYGLETYLSASASYMLLEFQVDAQLMTHLDRTRLEARGMVYGFAGGLRLPVTDRLIVAAEAFYAPLTVKRPGDTEAHVEGLLNARGLVEVGF